MPYQDRLTITLMAAFAVVGALHPTPASAQERLKQARKDSAFEKIADSPEFQAIFR